MRCLVLALVGACNGAFGLNDTRLPPPDAPPSCPATGVPRFSRNVNQTYLQTCYDFTASDDGSIAIAACVLGSSAGSVIAESVGGAPFTDAQFPNNNVVYEFPRVTGDGTQIYVRIIDSSIHYGSFHRDAGAWTFASDLTLPTGINFASGWITAPTMTSPRHMFAAGTGSFSQQLYELVEGPTDTWQIVQTYDPATLGFAITADPGFLSSDGLRLVLPAFTTTANRPLYLARASIDDPLTRGTTLDDVPPINDPYLSADCGRLYFSAIDSVFYVQQQ